MKIAQISPIIERVPPKKYGGTERVVSALTEELVKRGHDVTLFASGDSATTAHLRSVYPRGLRDAKLVDLYGANHLSMLNIGLAYAMQGEFDIVHDHTGTLGVATANIASTPVVMTMHGPFTPEVRRLFRGLNKPYLVAISNAQKRSALDLHYGGTVYNGLSMEKYPWSGEHDGYLLFVGRISVEKGVHFAIQTAQELNLPLIIAAKLEPTDRPYFHEYIEPFLSDQIRWIGEVDEEERNHLMSRAMCFLHAVTWPEPFGLALIEAMACGCPVVAFDMGSIPEVVRNKKTGYVVHDLQGMIEAVEQISSIDRRRCRRYSIRNFSAYRMANGYEAVYQKILNKEI
jgi:glycosyltransferase involved in cell wall biosynthesis